MFEQGGWQRVHYNDFGGCLNFLSNGNHGPIEYDGVALVARPTIIHDKAVNYQKRAATEPLQRARQMIEGGVDVKIGGGDHVTALQHNKSRSRRTYEPVQLPVPEK